MSELKPGESLDFTVDDKTLTIEPIPYGQIKKIMKIMFDAAQAVKGGELKTMHDLADRNLFAIFPLVFKAGKYPFVNQEWIENSLTVPVIRKMLEAAVVVNGLQDFLGKAVGEKLLVTQSPSTKETPSESSGSTTSPDLAMAGGPKTLTN